MKKGKNKLLFIVLTFAIGTLCFTNRNVFFVNAAEVKKVRVGFFAYDGYHIQNDNGKRSGYGYEYLQYLARYANFTYEYIGYEKDWKTMLTMLENGEIDLLTSGEKSKERMERFDFSEQPIGSNSAMITVKEGNSRYMVDDYKQLDGIRIGMLKENIQNQSLEGFAKKNRFTYHPVYFNNISELTNALNEGKYIDAILTSSLRKMNQEWIIATFDIKPFYVMVKKGNQALLDEINNAIGKLQRDNPNLPITLVERYYSSDNGNEIAYTAKERRYIKKLKNSGKTIKVTMNSGREPISYFVNGEAKGIIPEIAKEIMKKTEIPYEFIDTAPTVDARRLLTNKKALIRFDSISHFNDAEENNFRVTEPYLQLPLSCVTLKDYSGKPKSVAVIKNSDVVEEYVESVYDDTSITRYNSANECLKAVLTGKQEGAFFQTYMAQRFVNEDVKNRLKEQLVPGYGMSFAVEVSQEETILFAILEKAVLSMSSEEINHIVLEQTSYLTRKGSMIGYLYDHPVVWIMLFATAACFVIILLLYIFRRKKLSLEQEKNREFERFISYVCKANDSVIETEPARQIHRSYQVENGAVCCQEEEYSWNLQDINIHPEDRENVTKFISQENMERLIETGQEVYFECRIQKEEYAKRYQWVSFTLQGVPQEKENSGKIMIFVKNIDQAKSEEKEKRQALQDALSSAKEAGEAKGVFMSRMSHEIRTPLNAIIGYLTIAKSSIHNAYKMNECLDKSEFAAHHLLNIINDVLDISAIESGKMKIAHEIFNIKKLLSGITSIFRSQAAEKKVDFFVRLNNLTEEELIGDQLRLNQILMNLLSNAVKFTPSGGQVTLFIIQKTVVKQKIYLQFEIIDSGIGMSEEYKQRLFQPFEQQDAVTAQKFGGTGLGLSITKNLVTMMEGNIDVKSKEGSGTKFTVNLPFDMAEKQASQKTEIYGFLHLHVLALYSINSDYKYMKTILERFGVIYDIILEKEEALKKIAEEKEKGQAYDLCLVDWDIPDLDGDEILKQIEKAGTSKKPVIMAVAYEEPLLSLSSKGKKIKNVILKPVFQSSMFDALSNFCNIQTQEEKQELGEKEFDLNGMRVLLAEDNPMNMEIAKEILMANGILIDSAVNGKEAVDQFEESKEGTYQAILMDIQMPIMNGYEAAEKIRLSKHPQAKSILIVALSADAFAEDINHALAVGMNDHVSKPIDFKQLCKILSKYKKRDLEEYADKII